MFATVKFCLFSSKRESLSTIAMHFFSKQTNDSKSSHCAINSRDDSHFWLIGNWQIDSLSHKCNRNRFAIFRIHKRQQTNRCDDDKGADQSRNLSNHKRSSRREKKRANGEIVMSAKGTVICVDVNGKLFVCETRRKVIERKLRANEAKKKK